MKSRANDRQSAYRENYLNVLVVVGGGGGGIEFLITTLLFHYTLYLPVGVKGTGREMKTGG